MPSAPTPCISRRRFLRTLGRAGALGTAGVLIEACGGSNDGQSSNCLGASDLSERDAKQRTQMVEQLNYVSESPKHRRSCANCSLYQAQQYGAECGGCRLFPGPVSAEGYCDSWAPAS